MGSQFPVPPQKGANFRPMSIVAKRLGRMKMPLGMEVGLDPSDTVVQGTQLTLPKTGEQPPIFGPCLSWPNGWMDQDATWYGDRPRPRPQCARWGPSSSLLSKRGTAPIFSPCLLWPKGRLSQLLLSTCYSFIWWPVAAILLKKYSSKIVSFVLIALYIYFCISSKRKIARQNRR